MHQSVLHAKILETIMEPRVSHMDGQLAQDFGLAGVEIEPHFAQPFEGLWTRHPGGDEPSRHSPLVHKLTDEVL